MNEKIIGKGAVSIAIAYYGLKGMVSIPLFPGSYNLILDENGILKRIKAISCSYKSPYGIFMVNIRSMGGNMPHLKVKEFDSDSCDLVFVVTSDLEMYSIPSKSITSKRSISLKAYEKYKVTLGDIS